MKHNSSFQDMLRSDLSKASAPAGPAFGLEKPNVRSLKGIIQDGPVTHCELIQELTVTSRVLLREAYSKSGLATIVQEVKREHVSKAPLFSALERLYLDLSGNSHLQGELKSYFDGIVALGLDECRQIGPRNKAPDSWLSDFTSHEYFHQYLAIPETLIRQVNQYAERFFDTFRELQGVDQLLSRLAATRPTVLEKDLAALATSEAPIICREILKDSITALLRDSELVGGKEPVVLGLTAIAANTLIDVFSNQVITCLYRETDLANYSERIINANSNVKYTPERMSNKGYLSSDQLAQFNVCIASLAQQQKLVLRTLKSHPIIDSVVRHHEQLIADFPDEPRKDGPLLSLESLKFRPSPLLNVMISNPSGASSAYRLEIDLAKNHQTIMLDELLPGKNGSSEKRLQSCMFAVVPDGKFLCLNIGTYAPFNDQTISRLYVEDFKRTPICQTLTTLHQTMLKHLQIAQEALPEVFSRFRELPEKMIVQLLGNSIELVFNRLFVDDLRHFFSYDGDILAGFDKQMSDDPHSSTIRAKFILYKDQDQTTQSEVDPAIEQARLRREVSQLLYSNVSNFAELFSILKKHFEVTLSNHGKGGHKGLNRNGHYYALSSTFRSETDPLNHQIAVDLLEALHIPLRDVARLLKGD